MDAMNEPQDDVSPMISLQRLALAGRAVLLGERLAKALWPAAMVGCALLVVAVSGLLPELPGWLHGGVLMSAALGGGFALVAGFRGFAWPGAAEALRRIECDNALPHRPLQTLYDRPAGDDPGAAEIWHLHREQSRQRAAGHVRLHPPRLAALDWVGLRWVGGVALLAAAIGCWGEGGARLAAAFDVRLGKPGAAAVLDLWLSPPAYTGLAPVVWRRDGETAVVPAGSVVLARVSGGNGVPALVVDGGEVPLAVLDDDAHFEARSVVRAGTELLVRQDGRVLGRWPISVRPAVAPTVAFTQPPDESGRGALRLRYRAEDDYGVTAVAATVRPEVSEADSVEPLVIALPGGGGGERRHVEAASVHDLTDSPWAGLKVRVRLSATGAGGLTGLSDELVVTLPERAFTHPVARRLVAVRKALMLKGDAARADSIHTLAEISVRPDDFGGNGGVFLTLRVAVALLSRDYAPEALAAVRDLLWQSALRLEDGALGGARRDLDAAEKALREALDGKASDEEIRKRIDELETALARYLEQLERQQAGAPEPPTATERTDLDAMLQSLRDMAETGARDDARRLLSELGNVLDSLRASDGAPSPAQARGQELARQLQDIAAGEGALLDRTFAQNQERAPSAPPEADEEGAARQGALRKRLGAVLLELGDSGGDIPRSLGEAERAMRAAELALATGMAEVALAAEGEAVEKLRDGQREMTRAMGQRLVGAGGRDPLGRRRPGSAEGQAVRLPEQREVQRARQILEELHRRAGEPARPRQELDYIDRLLRRF